MASANVTTLVTQSSPNLITTIGIALGIFLIGLIVGRIVSKLVHKFLEFLGLEEAITKKGKKTFSIHKLISESVAIIVYVIFAIIALNYLGATPIIVTIIGSIAIIVVLISLLLSLRDSIPNMIAYNTILKERQINIGDTVHIDSVKGVIKKITVFEVQVQTKQEDIIHIPNHLFLREKYVSKKAPEKTKK
jgi:small-conductance mechanosensitive channel